LAEAPVASLVLCSHSSSELLDDARGRPCVGLLSLRGLCNS